MGGFALANTITEIGKNPVTNNIVAASSRYANGTLIYWGPLNKITFKTYVKSTQTPSSEDNFIVIKAGMEYRPDKLSQLVYGTPDYWWKIMEYNGMKDILEFKIGTNIVVPKNVMF